MEFTWGQIIERTDLLIADFQQLYHIQLEKVIHTETWEWFRIRVKGLLAQRSILLGSLSKKGT